MKKRLFSILLVLLLAFVSVSALADSVKVLSLKGPTSMGLAGMLDNSENSKLRNEYTFEIVKPEEAVAALTTGQVDIATIPANMAAALFNKTEGKLLKVIDINTLGVLYVVSLDDSVVTLEDLKGKDILAPNKGATPEAAFKYVLSQNGIDPEKDLNIVFKSEPTEIVAALKAGEAKLALLPQPFVTVAQKQVEGLKIVFSLSDEWDKLNNGSALVTGVTIVKKDFLENNKEAVLNYLEDKKDSVTFVNESPEKAAEILEKHDIFKAAIAKEAIPYCNIVYVDGAEMKTMLEGYLQVLLDFNAKLVGGKLPSEEFYAIFE